MNPSPPITIRFECTVDDAAEAAFAALQAAAWSNFQVLKWIAELRGTQPTAAERRELAVHAFATVRGFLPEDNPLRAALEQYRDAVLASCEDAPPGGPKLRAI